MNPKLQAIAGQASFNLQALIAEGSDDIIVAWKGCAREARIQEAKPKFRLTFSITLDLDDSKAEYDLTYGVRRRLSAVAAIPDPEQPQFPLGDTTVTIPTPTDSVTVSPEAFRAVVNDLRPQKASGV